MARSFHFSPATSCLIRSISVAGIFVKSHSLLFCLTAACCCILVGSVTLPSRGCVSVWVAELKVLDTFRDLSYYKPLHNNKYRIRTTQLYCCCQLSAPAYD
jgi:hypothetical protein